MKKIILMTILLLSMGFMGCAQKEIKQGEKEMKTLVAYFSASGVTADVAKQLSQTVKGELFEIVPMQVYTSGDLDWTNKNSRSTIEMRDKNSRPAIKFKKENIQQYDVIFVGFPIWWGMAPTIINTFLEQYDLKGKIIVPFFTSGGSGAGKTNDYLKVSASKSIFKPAKNLTNFSKQDINKWIDELNL